MNKIFFRCVAFLLVLGLIGDPAMASVVFIRSFPTRLEKEERGLSMIYDQQTLTTRLHAALFKPGLFQTGHYQDTVAAVGGTSPGSKHGGEEDWHLRLLKMLSYTEKGTVEEGVPPAVHDLLANVLIGEYAQNRLQQSRINRLIRSFKTSNRIHKVFKQAFEVWLTDVGETLAVKTGFLLNHAARLQLRATSEKISPDRQKELLKDVQRHIKQLGGSYGLLRPVSETDYRLPVSFKGRKGHAEISFDIEILNHKHVFENSSEILLGLNLPLAKNHYAILLQAHDFDSAAWKRTLNHEILEALRRDSGDSLEAADAYANSHESLPVDVLKKEIKEFVFLSAALQSTSPGASASAGWNFFDGGSRAILYGQRVVTGNGLSPHQAVELAARLENRETLRPHLIAPDTLKDIGKFLDALVRDPKNRRSRIILNGAGASLFYQLHNLIAYLGSGQTTLTLKPDPDKTGLSYDVQFKSVPGGEPFEIDHTQVWAFPLIEEPKPGMPGRITLYVGDLDNYQAEPERLAGVIYLGLTCLILPKDQAITPDQWHPLAVILEGIVGGEIARAPRSSEDVVVPERMKREIDRFPEIREGLGNYRRTEDKKEELARQFSAMTRVRDYLSLLAAVLFEMAFAQAEPEAAPALRIVVPHDRQIKFPDYFQTSTSAREEAEAAIDRLAKNGNRVIEIEDKQGRGSPGYLPIEDALEVAKKGFLSVKSQDTLRWNTNWRAVRVGGEKEDTEFESRQTLVIEDRAVILPGSLEFRLFVLPAEKDPEDPKSQPKIRVALRLMHPDEERSEIFDIGEKIDVGRIHGEFQRPANAALEPRHFSLQVLPNPAGGYTLRIENKSAAGIRVMWPAPPVQGFDSAPRLTAMLAIPMGLGWYGARMSEILQMPFLPSSVVLPQLSTTIFGIVIAIFSGALWHWRQQIKAAVKCGSLAVLRDA